MEQKRILWITDDQINHRDIYVANWEETGKLILTKEFTLIDNIDFVIVDYGHLDNINNVNILKKYHLKGIKIVWSGGFGGSDRYSEDSKKVFPKEKWLHKIDSVELSDLIWYVNNYFKEVSLLSSHD